MESFYKKVLLLCIDDLRADYAYQFMNSLKEYRSNKFLNHHAHGNHTLQNISYLLTGKLDTGLTDSDPVMDGKWRHLRLKVPTIADYFKNRGWNTLAITGGAFADLRYFNYGGFDNYAMLKNFTFNELDCICGLLKEKTFLFLHTYNVHRYLGVLPDILKKIHQFKNINQKELRRMESEYFKKVKEMDKILYNLLKKISLEGTLIIITADHGECFLEISNSIMHGKYAGMNEYVTHIPLIINVNNKIVNIRSEEIDVVPTILNIVFGENEPTSFDGKSLIQYL